MFLYLASAEAVAAAKAAQNEMYSALLTKRATLLRLFEQKAARYKEILIKEMVGHPLAHSLTLTPSHHSHTLTLTPSHHSHTFHAHPHPHTHTFSYSHHSNTLTHSHPHITHTPSHPHISPLTHPLNQLTLPSVSRMFKWVKRL